MDKQWCRQRLLKKILSLVFCGFLHMIDIIYTLDFIQTHLNSLKLYDTFCKMTQSDHLSVLNECKANREQNHPKQNIGKKPNHTDYIDQ